MSINLTPEQAEQARERLGNREWRLANLYAVTDKQGRLVKFKPNHAQVIFYDSGIHDLNYTLKSRQHGFSTFTAIFYLDRLLFEPDKVAGLIDYTLPDAKMKLAKMRLAYENLDNPDVHPDTYQLGALIKESRVLTTDAKEELAWNNGSRAYCGTSLRGGTIQYLHVSEFGKIAFRFPDKAREILEGALNAVHEGSITIFETTHEGGRTGSAYNLCRRSMTTIGQSLTRLDWKFHFFAWWQDRSNELPCTFALTQETQRYFAELLTHPWIIAASITAWKPEKMAWYQKKRDEQGFGMLKEHPSVPEEAFQAIIEGAIYGDLVLQLRSKGRIREFEHDRTVPMFTFWDIGMSDYTSIWPGQWAGRDILIPDYYEDNGKTAADHVNQIRRWEEQFKLKFAGHYLPHDANRREVGSGKSYVDFLREAGLTNVYVVPRSPDIWPAINHTRALMPRMFFHARCDTPRIHLGEELPSGVANLEAYHTHPADPNKQLRELPVHDSSSHAADALRTLAEAESRGIIDYDGAVADRLRRGGKPPVLVGVGNTEPKRHDPLADLMGDYQSERVRVRR